MIVLGIETATYTGSVALVDERHQFALYELGIRRTHSERLLKAIQCILEDTAFTLRDIQGIAVSIGPGSFTGIRIGLSTAKGLCFANNLPLAAVCTLDAMASRFPFSRVPVCPMLDARKKEVYTALYDMKTEQPVPVLNPRVIGPDEFLEDISEPTLFLGNGALLYQERIVRKLGDGALFPPVHLSQPSSAAVARLGLGMLQKGEQANLYEIEPIYLRMSEAQLARRG